MKRLGFALAAVLMLAGCATTGTVAGAASATDRALVDVDKALIVADAGYAAAEKLALSGVRSKLLTGDARLEAGNASDLAEAALHRAHQVRTSAAIALAVTAIAAFAAAAKGGT